ncbi:ATP-binding cassette domain-containing protein [Archangium primigenium]|uniref:ATP-binding cassette domain-containing protein n=1 Tax=[Archangium] primigenium TaxID=2792470 RepID=UPI001EF8A323|nr:ATP-binding cassette domain-containing protein [Archangium primigenium]
MQGSPTSLWTPGDALASEKETSEATSFPSLAHFIQRLRQAHAVGGVAALAQVMRRGRLEARHVEPYALKPTGRYTRTLVYRDEDLEIIVMGWGRGSCSPIHGHDGQDCVLSVIAGELEVSDYRLVAGGRAPGPAVIEHEGAPYRLPPGTVAHNTVDQELHAVRPAGRGTAISLHVYSRPIDTCLSYDLQNSRCETRVLRYDRVMTPTPPAAEPTRPSTASRPAPRRFGRFWRTLFRSMRRVKETVKETLVPARVDEQSAKIAVKRMEHRYANKVVALQDVNLNIRSGEFVCLLGPSGCGKSTLLYALAGHIHPTGGHVRLDGREIQGPGPDRLLMFQEAALYPWLSVRQNLEFVLAARGLSRKERAERTRRFLHYVHLDGFEDVMPHELSGGMKMRTALARALAVDSQVLLMDEPFGSLDAQTRQHMHELLQRIWLETHKTIVFVTHDVTEALVLANRVVVMAPRPGRILRDFEVRLPMPRGPDDMELVGLARQIRTMLHESESLEGSGTPGEDGAHDEGMAPGSEAVGARGPAGRLGTVRAIRPLAPSPVSGTEGGR